MDTSEIMLVLYSGTLLWNFDAVRDCGPDANGFSIGRHSIPRLYATETSMLASTRYPIACERSVCRFNQGKQEQISSGGGSINSRCLEPAVCSKFRYLPGMTTAISIL